MIAAVSFQTKDRVSSATTAAPRNAIGTLPGDVVQWQKDLSNDHPAQTRHGQNRQVHPLSGKSRNPVTLSDRRLDTLAPIIWEPLGALDKDDIKVLGLRAF